MALIIIAALYVKRFSFIWSPFSKGGLQTKNAEPIGCIKNATYRPRLVLH